MARKIKIGIASCEYFKQYTLSIARGERKPKKNNEPTIWFQSIESMAQILSSENLKLLRTIRDNHPQSITELADVSGRQVGNLSRTLRTMEKYGIVRLNKENKAIKPQICADTFCFIFGI